jgi:hypothetical protein
MLREKANDSTSAYASALSHGLHGTYYCFRTQGPRRCFSGRKHSGSNNFNLLKRGRNVFYRCHGDQCSHEPVKKLGKLTLEASLQDATTAPVDQYDDMEVITRHTRGSSETQNLLLQMVIAHAGRDAYANLGRLFAYLYLIEGRILTTVHEAEKSRKGAVFYVWDGSLWIQDTFNLASNVFISQMGCLLEWYEVNRDAYECKLRSEHPDLQPFWNQETRELDVGSATGKQIALIKRASQSCQDKVNQDMPSFGQLNVQDPSHVIKCLHSTITELFVAQLAEKFDQNPCVANAANGLIDLKTGQLDPHHPKDLCNNQTFKYVRGASRAPTASFRDFIISVLCESVVDWVQMYLGYRLTGETCEELFAILNGCGGNGKAQLKLRCKRRSALTAPLGIRRYS